MKSDNIGQIGEQIARTFLTMRGYRLLECNYRIASGEVDIIATKAGITHFVEVKTVTREIVKGVSRERGYDPEEKVDKMKLIKIQRVAEYYVNQKNVTGEVQVSIVGVYVDPLTRKAKCRLTLNVL